MEWKIVSFCPWCGGPIWIQEPSPIQDLPSPAYFSCDCRSEKVDLQKKLETLEVENERLKNNQTSKKMILGD
jgi:hypothetical protein